VEQKDQDVSCGAAAVATLVRYFYGPEVSEIKVPIKIVMLRKISAVFVSLCIVKPCWSDLPLTIEDLITNKGRARLNLSGIYSSSDRMGLVTVGSIPIATQKINRDLFISTVALRYGFTEKIEVHGRGSFLYSSVRSGDTVGGKTKTAVTNSARFGDSWLGINYRLKEDDATPGIIVSTEAALWERFGTNVVFLKSFTAGMTAYKAIDPVVFSCDMGYRFGLRRNTGDQDVRPGSLLWISPSVAFSANDRVTLATGFRWTGRGADHHYGKEQSSFYRTRTDLQLGMGYAFANDTILNVRLTSTLSGGGSAEIGASFLYTF